MWKHLVLRKVEENRPALPKSQLIAITDAAAMTVFEDVTLLGADLGIICRKIKPEFIPRAGNGIIRHLHIH